MAFEFSNDELKKRRFLNEVLNDTQTSTVEKSSGKKKKAARQSVSPNPQGKKRQSTKATGKENSNPEEEINKKSRRVPKKNEREPLKAVNREIQITPSSKKKKAVSQTKKCSALKGMKSSTKEKQSIPKITVYQDAAGRAQEKNSKSERVRKSDVSNRKMSRRSLPETKSPKSSASARKNVRRTINDFNSVKDANKREKSSQSGIENQESPAVGKPRQSKLKPGHPQFEEFSQKLQDFFPNVDPDFMKSQLAKLKGSISDTIEFILLKEKTNELPTRDDYEKRLETENLEKKFLENFSIEKFLKIHPDPWEHFLKTERHHCKSYMDHSFHYLKNKYDHHYLRTIEKALAIHEGSLYLANKELKKKNPMLKIRTKGRTKHECDSGKPTNFDIRFIHEVAFIENETKIKSYLKKLKTSRSEKLKEAEVEGTLLECQYCNDFSLLEDDAVNCPDNHVFCKDCVVKHVQVKMEKSNFQFSCLVKCEKKISMESLQTVLGPHVIVQIIRRNQLEEMKSTGIEDLIFCPLCFYVMVIPLDVTIIKCLNPSCMLESCRYCKQPSHTPLNCHDLVKPNATALELEEEVYEELKILENEENLEEEYLPLVCTLCNGEFIKKENSIHLVCPCEAVICSVCRLSSPECPHSNIQQPLHCISSSSDETECAEVDDNAGVDNPDRSLYSLENFLRFPTSDSDVF